mmetsp:Transcript_9344/g.23011  ORF Transcript_9344/g.23011 Transcript_9344/m.23011 type:complete len:439 (-) Transcript_9344:326-1642(-)
MPRITVDLIRKKAEHNNGILEDLEELSLHQLNLEKIEVISSCCKHLKILYLQNNLLPKIENLRKLKELEYLNLALNNIKKIEGLQSCESLAKLDLTVNFVSLQTFEESILNLRKNLRLKNLFLSGNPCCDFKGYRNFVVASLPWLEKLDGSKITKSERIIARQQLETNRKELRRISGVIPVPEDDSDNGGEAFTAENRVKWYLEDLKEEKEREEAQKKAASMNKPPDPLKEARDKMSKKVVNIPEGTLPKQRNMARVKFSFGEDEEGNVIATIHAPKFLDTSQIEVDIHPKWFQCMIKDRNILLHTPEEVHPDKSKIKRTLHNGHLILTMPKANWNGGKTRKTSKQPKKSGKNNSTKKEREEKLRERENLAVDYKNIVKNNAKAAMKTTAPAVNLGFLSHKHDNSLKQTKRDRNSSLEEGADDDSSDPEEDADVPPLI